MQGRKTLMTKEETLAYIHSVSWMGSRPGLSRTRELLKKLGDPQKELKFIHIAGTNGKGSASAMLYSVLLKAGIRAGLYTSPYIESFNERIQAMGHMISDEELAYVTQIIKRQADRMRNKPTEFELITCIALEYFKRKGIKLVVLETGMGGELDSTNVIDTPEAAVIMAMSYDHTETLGGSMEQIASAKAGIIKEGGDVVSYGNDPEAERVFRQTAERRHARIINPDFAQLICGGADLEGQTFSYKGFQDIAIPFAGGYQVKNAAVVLETLELLRKKGYAIDDGAVKEGLRCVRWGARFEVIGRRPAVIVDGAHNPAGMREAADSLERLFETKVVFIMGVMADKDLKNMLPFIFPLARRFFTVTPDNPRAMTAEELAKRLRDAGADAQACQTMAQAAKEARAAAGQDGVVCALGSLYMAGGIKKALLEER